MLLISKFNKGIKYLLCAIDLLSRYAWVIGLKNKKGESTVEGFQSILILILKYLNKHMTYVGKNVYFDVLDDTVRKCNSTVHSSIKMKPKDVKSKRFPEHVEESNKKDPKFKVGHNIRISKYKNGFAKGNTPN